MQVAKYWRNNALRYRLQGTLDSNNNYSLQSRPIAKQEERDVETVVVDKIEKVKVA